MKPTKEYFEKVISTCRQEQERLRMDFERQEGVVKFCQMLIEKQIYVEEEQGGRY